jgi:hypothetical protein
MLVSPLLHHSWPQILAANHDVISLLPQFAAATVAFGADRLSPGLCANRLRQFGFA